MRVVTWDSTRYLGSPGNLNLKMFPRFSGAGEIIKHLHSINYVFVFCVQTHILQMLMILMAALSFSFDFSCHQNAHLCSNKKKQPSPHNYFLKYTMFSPLGFSFCALLPRVYTCRWQTLLRISGWVKKCPAVLHLITLIHQTRCWLSHGLIHPSIPPSNYSICGMNPSLRLQSGPQIVLLRTHIWVLLSHCGWGSFSPIWQTGDSPLKCLHLTHWCGG